MSRIFTLAGKPYSTNDKIGFGRRQRIQEQHFALYRKDCPDRHPHEPSDTLNAEGEPISNYAYWFVYGGAGQRADFTLAILQGLLKPYGTESPAAGTPDFEELFLDATEEEVNAVVDFFYGTAKSKTNEPNESNGISMTTASPVDTTGTSPTTTPDASSSTALTTLPVG